MHTLFRILVIELLLAFIFTNILYINNVFLINKPSIEPTVLKIVYLVLVLCGFMLIGLLSGASVVTLFISLSLGVRHLRKLKRAVRIEMKLPNLNYYWEVYRNRFLRPVSEIYLYGALGTTTIYLANYFVLK